MPRPRAPYLTAELELVKSKLPGILTRRPDGIANWVRKEHSSEVLALAKAFNRTASQCHKWQAAVLAQVPVSAWASGPGAQLHLKPSSAASMRYLSRESLGEDAVSELKQVETRKMLFVELLEQMSPSSRSIYRPMLRWVPYDELGDTSVAQFPLSSDTAFGYNLFVLENMMAEQLRVYEEKWHTENNWPEDQSIPSEVTRACSLGAQQHLSKLVERWCEDSARLSCVPESLLALTSANLSVNRALLELAAAEARGMEAASMNEKFLRALNQRGVLEVPHVIDDCGPDEFESQLRKILISWFGHGGLMLQPSSISFRRPMNTSDIDMVVLWSGQLQQTYMQERGAMGGPDAAHKAHGSSCNRFIFAIVMAGAFYCNTGTAHEFTGHSNSTYAVFPDRGEVVRGKRETPPTHAAHFLKQAYGQVFFANSGWDLRFERVREYAETASIKRSHLQQLLHFAVKKRTSRELLALHQNLQRVR